MGRGHGLKTRSTAGQNAIRDSRIAVISFWPAEYQAFPSALSTDRLLHSGAREAARRSSRLLPFLQRSLRDLQTQRRLTLREILPLAPRAQPKRERPSGQALMPRMMRSCPESHCRKHHAIRDSRIASFRSSSFLLCEACAPGGEGAQQPTARRRPPARLKSLAEELAPWMPTQGAIRDSRIATKGFS